MTDQATPSSPSASADASAASGGVWGGFVVAGMSLALPLAVLREVVPLATLLPLPASCVAVVGGLAIRGVTVPVLDLRRLIDVPADRGTPSCVIVVVHEGRLMGLLADGISGVFTCQPGSRVGAGLRPSDASRTSLFGGSLRRADNDQLTTLLSIDALLGVPGLPWIDDPEPRRSQGRSDVAEDLAEGPARHALMTVACGDLRLGLDAMAVHGTLWAPKVETSVLGRGACRGTVVHHGLRIAAIDLLELCGLGRSVPADCHQALVLRNAHGLVAMLVGSVQEIIYAAGPDIAPMPPHALPRVDLFRGMLPRALEQAHAAAVESTSYRPDCLVLNGDALVADDLVSELARANTPVDPRESRAAGDTTVAMAGAATSQTGAIEGLPVITFDLEREVAVPLDQVREVLPYGQDDGMFGPDSTLRRLQVVDGRTVPIHCLSRLMGCDSARVPAPAAVLVIEVGGHVIGYGVPPLKAIDRASWDRQLPAHGAGSQRRIISLGAGIDKRTLQLLDLAAVAHQLQAGTLTAA